MGSNEKRMDMSGMNNMWMTEKSGKSRKMDFFNVLDSVCGIWQVIGNFPMYFTGSDNSRKCRFSKFIMGYHVALLFTCVGLITTALMQMEFLMKMEHIVMTIALVIRTLSSVICMLINSLMWIFYHKDFIDAVDFLASQASILRRLGCRLNYAACRKMIRTCVYGALMMMSMIVSYDCYLSMTTWASSSPLSIAQWLFWNIPIVIRVMTFTIFESLVIILGLHFRELNTKLMAIRDRSNSLPPKVIELSNECAEGVRLVAKIHYNLCKISKFINWIFNGFFVVTVAEAFVILSSSLYFIFNEVVKPGNTNYMAIGNYICWLITTAVPIIVTVIICNWTSNEAEHTGKLIHEISVQSTESKLYQIIRSLSLQLHHQNIEFTGAGLFPINSSLLQAMIGNMTTSLVILIQFQPSLDYG